MDAAEIELRDSGGSPVSLTISRLPSSLDHLEMGAKNRVVLREARTYRYQLSSGPWARLEPAELFSADDETLCTGRLSPAEAVGIVSVEATDTSGRLHVGQLDIRSAKFEDETAFSTMIADLARLAVESLHQGF